ncbi:MAG TPA: hypothetical protein EYG89_01225 [Bacteroidia bacterium]|nr:hypothetical protein [Bacteroidia bacterium]
MKIENRGLSKDKIFGYIGFIASIATIADLMRKYLFTNQETSFSLTRNSALELFFIVFLMFLSMFFLSKEKKNTDFLTVAGYLYAFISFLIYIVTAYQYIMGDNDIKNFSLEIFLIFLTSFSATIIIFKQLNDKKHFNKYAYLFVIGLFIVLGMLFIKMVIFNDSQMKISHVLIYMLGGTGLFSLLFFFSKETIPKNLDRTTSIKVEDARIDDDARW